MSVSCRICFLDQSGELGGAELCLADFAEFARQRSTAVLFGEGPFAQVLQEHRNHYVIVEAAIRPC